MITPDLTLSNKTRYQRSVQDYIGTLPEQPNTLTGLLNLNPQSRYQVTENTANQTELTYKFNTFGWKHTALAGVEVSREISSIDRYTGLSSEALGNQGAPSGTITGASIFYPQYTYFQPTSSPQWTGLPTRVAIDTQSVYAMDSANYNDKIILNGGVRYDNYDVKATGFGTASGQLSPNLWNAQEVRSGMPNFNLGLTLKPMPIGSVYVAYATSTNPVGSEFDGTSAQYGGLAGFLAGNPNQVFGPEKNKAIEVGTKWELFDRHMLVTAALFQTEKDNARESQNVTTAAQAAAIPGCAYTLVSPAPESCISAGAAYRIRGIDLGMGGKITDRWSMMAGLVLMQSEVTNSQLRVTPSRCSMRAMSDCRWPTSRISRSACSPSISSTMSGNSAARRCTGRRSMAVLSSPPTRARRFQATGASTPLRKPSSTRTGRRNCSSPTSPTSSTMMRSTKAPRPSFWSRRVGV